MNGSATRAAARRMTSSEHVVVMDVTQRPRARRKASGTFRVTEKATGVTLTMTEFGQLQTALRLGLVHRPRLACVRRSPSDAVLVILDGDELIVRADEFSATLAVRSPSPGAGLEE